MQTDLDVKKKMQKNLVLNASTAMKARLLRGRIKKELRKMSSGSKRPSR